MATTISDQTSELRNKCWVEACECFGTAEIFQKRAANLRLKLILLTYLGLVVPLAVGGLVISFGFDFKYKEAIIAIASILGLTQLVLSLWSLVSKWDDRFAYSLESFSSNRQISFQFKEIAQSPPDNFQDFKTRYDFLQVQNNARTIQDDHYSLSDREKRFGMRAALWQFQRSCAVCKKTPKSLTPSNCDVCGNF